MPAPKPRLPLTLTRTLGAALALAAVGAALSLRRYAGRKHLRDRAGQHAEDPDWSAERLGGLDGERFFRLCAAYYKCRRFHMRDVRSRPAARDAALYFGTLPYPVAIVRVIACGAGAVGIDAIRDLAHAMSSRHVAKGIVHATGGYTDAALKYARAHSIRLVTGEDLVRNVAGMSPSARASLSQALGESEAPGDPQRELTLH